jgi:hypothetical protein
MVFVAMVAAVAVTGGFAVPSPAAHAGTPPPPGCVVNPSAPGCPHVGGGNGTGFGDLVCAATGMFC